MIEDQTADPASAECSVCHEPLAEDGVCFGCLAANCLFDIPSASEVTESLPGAGLCGDYELLEFIGRGGMGMVFRARRISDGREVALKTIPQGDFASDALLKRFRKEAELLSRLDHPGIVKLLDMGVNREGVYFAMDFVEGVTLDRACAEGRIGPVVSQSYELRAEVWTRAARFMEQLARAVHEAHTKGVIHRDLKPTNILVNASLMPRVTDFGLARDDLEDLAPGGLTLTGQMLGTPHYMAPEQVEGKEAGRASDVWALGAVLYFIIAKRPPHASRREFDLFNQIVRDDPAPLTSLAPSMPKPLEWIVGKCLEKSPSRRYVSAEALAEDLRRFVNGERTQAGPIPWHRSARKWIGRHRWIAALFGLSVLAAAGIVWAWRSEVTTARKLRFAEAEARGHATRSETTAKLLSDILRGVDPSIAREKDTSLLRDLLDQAVSRAAELSDAPEAEADLRQLLGEAYDTIAQPGQAEIQFRRARDLRVMLYGNSDARTLRSQAGYGKSLSDLGRTSEAVSELNKALALKGPQHDPGTTHIRFLLGRALLLEGDNEEARRQLEICLREPARDNRDLEPLAARFLLAGMLVGDEKLTAALREYELCESGLRRSGIGNHPFLADTLSHLAEVALWLDDEARAATVAREAVGMYEAVYGQNHPRSWLARLVETQSAGSQEEQERLAKALYSVSVTPGWGRAHFESGWILARCYKESGRMDEARKLYGDLESLAPGEEDEEAVRRELESLETTR